MAKLIKENRIAKNLSQGDLSKKLEYKNGQFVSNIERSLCSVPQKVGKNLCDVLGIHPQDMMDAYMKDYEGNTRRSLFGEDK